MKTILFYHLFLLIGIIAGLPVILARVLTSPRRRATVLQRMGITALPPRRKPGRGRIWVHALSVGEVISSVPLVKAMRERFPDQPVCFSASTRTGFETARQRLEKDVEALFYFPYDLLFSVRRIVKRVQPDFMVIVETDIWPGLLWEMDSRSIPVFLVNTRLSQKSFTGYRRFGSLLRPVFRRFARVCPQSRADAERFRKLGVPPEKIIITGNIKFDQPVEPLSATELESLRQRLRIDPDRRIIVAGSTHEGEETILAEAFQHLRQRHPDLFLIVVPRNPDRARRVCGIFSGAGVSAMTMTEAEQNPSGTACDILVVDRIGVLKQLYGLADAAFVGGSLIPFGGHNPLEPAALAKPVLFGPHMSEFAEISHLLLTSGGAVQVADGAGFSSTVDRLFGDREAADRIGQQALQVFRENKGAVQRTLDVIEAYRAR